MKKSTVAIAILAAVILTVSAFSAEAFLASLKSPSMGEKGPGDGQEKIDLLALSEEDAAGLLGSFGIMSGTAGQDGTPDYAVGRTVTRQEFAVLLARALGYTGAAPDMDYPDPFTDTADWASGAVGFLCARGVLGASKDTLSPDEPATIREVLTMALNVLGVEPAGGNLIELARSMSLIGKDEDMAPESAATRGEAAAILVRLLCSVPRGDEKSVLARLAESGSVPADAVRGRGLGGYLTGFDKGAVSAAYAMEKFGPSVVSIETQDLMFNTLKCGHGCIIAQGIVAAPMDLLPGASYVKIHDYKGNEIAFTGVYQLDENAGLAFLACDAGDAGLKDAAGGNGASSGVESLSTVYSVSGLAVPGTRGNCCARPGLPVMGPRGEFVGVTSLAGTVMPEVISTEAEPLFDLNLRLWPDVAPPFRGRGIDPELPMTALTFDDGPSTSVTPLLLDLLEEEGDVATFFEVGLQLNSYTGSLAKMEKLGCEIANHTYGHKDLTGLDAQGVHDQIEKVNDIVRGVLGHGTSLVRPPYGSVSSALRSEVDYPMICWNVDTEDWNSKDPEKIFQMIKREKSLDGDIILMHSIYSSTLEASKEIIPWIKQQGYQLVTVSEMAYFRGVELKAGSVYYNFPK